MSLDDQTIEEGQWIDLYVTGKLSPEDTARFEEYFLTRDDLIDQIEAAERLQRGLRQVAEEEVTRATLQASVEAAQQHSWRRRAGILAVVAFVATGLLFLWNQRQIGELNSKLVASEQQQQQSAQEHLEQTARLHEELSRSHKRLDAAEEQWQTLLNASNNRITDLQRLLATAKAPRVNPKIFRLNRFRDVPFGQTPTNSIELADSDSSIVLEINVVAPPGTLYKAILTKNELPTWETQDLKVGEMQTLTISFSGDFLEAGEYYLLLTPTIPTPSIQEELYSLEINAPTDQLLKNDKSATDTNTKNQLTH